MSIVSSLHTVRFSTWMLNIASCRWLWCILIGLCKAKHLSPKLVEKGFPRVAEIQASARNCVANSKRYIWHACHRVVRRAEPKAQ
ncbi:hypothetical protein GGR55DRAFT_655261 [Xylaria sp. FL0064]|nr:hypothetical protein GGR55DRAFT_655261 [Xylaria sp. FL0064]